MAVKDAKHSEAYERKREDARQRQSAASRSGRDIGEIPPVKDPTRKAACERNLRLFLETYFPHLFVRAWSKDHLHVIARIEKCVLAGGSLALAMPRGSGKSTLFECSAAWAVLYGHQSFVVIVAADAELAGDRLAAIQGELEANDLLAEDFPEAIYPIRKLDGIPHRARGQLHNGERTRITWSSDKVVMPTIPGSRASGACLMSLGITGSLLGLKHRTGSGKSIRPQFIFIDDPQTLQSAMSASQTATREKIIQGSVLGLAGVGKPLAAVAAMTVIARDDLADRLLNRDRHPDWQGERFKLVYKWPTETALWDEYCRIRIDDLKAGGDGARATAYYRKNRAAMDAGAEIAWPARFNDDELSAIQHAYNLRIKHGDQFWSEYQNDPVEEQLISPQVTAKEIIETLSRIPRDVVPAGHDHLAAFIDVQQDLLYWMVAGFAEDFTGSIIAYGAYPDQGRKYFTLRDARPTISQVHAKAQGLEGQLFAALGHVCDDLLAREWECDGGGAQKIERLLIDANWGQSTDVVYQFCRQSPHAALLAPSHGRPIGAKDKPMMEFQKRRGEKIGFHWYSPVRGKRPIRHVQIDVNFWKTFINARLGFLPGDRGALSLFGSKGSDHQLLAEHLTAEFATPVTVRGKTVEEWKQKPGKDNHWLDCLVGCCVGAAMSGCDPMAPQKAAAKARRAEAKNDAPRPAAGRTATYLEW